DRIAVLAALNLAFELSELEANALKTSRNTVPTAAPAAARVDAPGSVQADSAQPQLAALLQRLDSALGVDGRLL
ncbi:MAG: cell division protein ZapA, partial [Polaromonas sp.]|nr:cell division protein ZapA [Polaromonas sp.]